MDRLLKHFKTISLLAACILMLIGTNLTWIERPVFSGIKAFKVSVIPGLIDIPSFGILGTILSIVLLISIFINRPSLKIWPGIVSITLSVLFLINIAFLNPARFKAIFDEVNTYKSVINFSKTFLPPNPGIEPVYSINIEPERVIDRLIFTWHIMGWGWFMFLAGSAVWLSIVGRKEWFKKNTAYIILAVSISLIPSVPYALSRYYIGKANAHWAEGGYSKAVQEFEFAKRINPAIDYSSFYNINLGRMKYFLGRGDNFYYYLYGGMVLAGEGRIEEAEDAYSKAIYMSRGTSASTVIRDLYMDFLITNGLAEYRKNRVGNAITNLSKAVEIAPDNFRAYFVLGKVLYDNSQYEKAIMMNKNILHLSVNPFLNANVNANIGDCYSKLGEYGKAREFYETSMELKRRGNFRAFEDLSGT